MPDISYELEVIKSDPSGKKVKDAIYSALDKVNKAKTPDPPTPPTPSGPPQEGLNIPSYVEAISASDGPEGIFSDSVDYSPSSTAIESGMIDCFEIYNNKSRRISSTSDTKAKAAAIKEATGLYVKEPSNVLHLGLITAYNKNTTVSDDAEIPAVKVENTTGNIVRFSIYPDWNKSSHTTLTHQSYHLEDGDKTAQRGPAFSYKNIGNRTFIGISLSTTSPSYFDVVLNKTEHTISFFSDDGTTLFTYGPGYVIARPVDRFTDSIDHPYWASLAKYKTYNDVFIPRYFYASGNFISFTMDDVEYFSTGNPGSVDQETGTYNLSPLIFEV